MIADEPWPRGKRRDPGQNCGFKEIVVFCA
jgi:hypothetical protein